MARAAGDLARPPTVLGAIPAEQLGVTLIHEHVIADITALSHRPAHPGREWLASALVADIDPALLARDPLVCKDNCVLDDEDTAVTELGFFAAAGGGTVVECTSTGLRPDIVKLARIAARVDVHIVAPTGYYLWFTCEPEAGGATSTSSPTP